MSLLSLRFSISKARYASTVLFIPTYPPTPPSGCKRKSYPPSAENLPSSPILHPHCSRQKPVAPKSFEIVYPSTRSPSVPTPKPPLGCWLQRVCNRKQKLLLRELTRAGFQAPGSRASRPCLQASLFIGRWTWELSWNWNSWDGEDIKLSA